MNKRDERSPSYSNCSEGGLRKGEKGWTLSNNDGTHSPLSKF